MYIHDIHATIDQVTMLNSYNIINMVDDDI
jgi:hypothetical protein